MSQSNCNCIICAQEFNPNDSLNEKLSDINISNFKICISCLEISDPSNDYSEVRDIVNTYLKYSSSKETKISDRIEKIIKFQ
jgi:hypothetical protein